MTKFFIYLLFVFAVAVTACNTDDKNKFSTVENLKNHIEILASDSLGGREAGTENEIKARDYIVTQMKAMGLKPFFGDSFFKSFDFKDGADYSESTLSVNGKSFIVGKDFSPWNKSRSGKVEGSIVDAGYGIMSSKPSHNDYPNHNILDGKIFLMEMSVPGGAGNWESYAEVADLDKRIELTSKFGAKAVILINSDSTFDDPRKMISNNPGRTAIPVIVAKKSLAAFLKDNPEAEVSMNVSVNKFDKTGYNVAGVIDNGASASIIIGAHYDHLGMGGETSRYDGPPAVHNGADDNASGVAAVLELARQLKDKKLNYNVLVMSFSGEEKGLLGSSALIRQNEIDKDSILCMLNFDMVGRMDSALDLTVFGTGTALEWDSVLGLVNYDTLNIKPAPSGIGGSDQMSFYLDSIPVLFFFTGFHNDYHTPSDDADRINYQGIEMVVDYAASIIENLNDFDGLTYHKAKARTSHKGNYRKGPTLGIVPDFGGAGEGLTVQAVLDDRPAAKAGLQKGDVIIKIGDTEIKDIYDYMDALKKCSKGKSYEVVILRKGEKLNKTVDF
jgi:hypothetical protein